MKNKLALIFLVLFVYFAQSQVKFLEIPKLDIKDLQTTTYEKNNEEAAEVLYTSYHYWVEDNGNLNVEVFKRIKIYNKDKADKFLNNEIYTYSNSSGKTESISNLQVLTYNVENSKIISNKIEKSSKYKSKENKNATVTKFAFENVKNGSVIEYKYKIISPFYWSIRKVQIEEDIPIRVLDYVFDSPIFLGYNIEYKGEIAPTHRDVGAKLLYGLDYYTYRFRYVDVKPYREEKYVKNMDNFKTTIRFELNSTNVKELKTYAVSWKDVSQQLYESDFGKELNKKGLVKSILPEEIKEIASKEERAEAVLRFVQKNYTWNKEYDVSVDEEKGIKNLISTKIGNSAEINLLLIMLMRSVNLDAQPVVMSTVGRGFLLDNSPSVIQLNYVIASLEINNKLFIYDANSKISKPNIIRPEALNYVGYLMPEKDAKRVSIENTIKSETFLTISADLLENGMVKGQFSDLDTNLYAMMNAEYYDENKEDYHKQYKEKYRFPFSNLKTELLENRNLVTSFDFDADSFVDDLGGKYIINPLLFLYGKNHDFDQTEERRSPIEFTTPYNKIKKVNLTIPEGYEFEKIPKSQKIVTEDKEISYTYKVSQKGNVLEVETTVSIEHADYPKEYYPAFKQIFDNITKLESQVATVVKKK